MLQYMPLKSHVHVMQLLQELHVVDWAACDKPAAPYRRIEDYMTSALKPKSNTHGVISDSEFSKMKSIAERFLNPRYVSSSTVRTGGMYDWVLQCCCASVLSICHYS